MKVVKLKTKRKFLAATSFIIASSAIIARADYINVSDQAVAFALTRTTYIGGTFETDQNSGKLTKIPAFNNVVKKYDKSNNLVTQVTTQASQAVTGKIGNLQVLEAIKDVFLDGTTRGWSIVVRDNQDGTYVTLATKKNKADVDLSGVIPLSLPPVGAYNEKETYQATYASNGSVISQSTVYSGSGAFEGPFSLKINGDQLFASGFMPYKHMTCYEDPSDKNTPTIVPILGAVFLKNFIGLEFNEDNQSPIVYGGSISLTEAKGTLVKSGPRTQSSGTGGSSGTITGSFSKSGNGTLILSGNHSYTGATTIAPGTLTLSGNNTLMVTGTIGSTGTPLTLSGNNGTVSVSGGTWTNTGALSVGAQGTGSLTINGTGRVIVGDTLVGTLTLSGNNGTVSISGGTLTISGNTTYNGWTTINPVKLTFSGNNTYTIISGTLTIGNNTYTAGMTVPAPGR